MYIESQREYISENNIEGIVFKENWKEYELLVTRKDNNESQKLSIENLLQSSKIEFVNNENEADQIIFDYLGNKYTIVLEYRIRRICYFLLKKACPNYYLRFKKGGYELSKATESDLIEDSHETKEDLMYNYLRRDDRARELIPCAKKYSVLQIKRRKLDKYVNIEGYLDYPCMICPYVRKYDVEHANEAICLEYDIDSKVINTTYDNRINPDVTKKQILDAYAAFKKEWDPIVEKVNSKAKKESLDSDLFRCRAYRILL